VPSKLARFLHQELAFEGGEAAMPPHVDERFENETNVILVGTRYQLQHLAIRIEQLNDDAINLLANELKRALTLYDDSLRGAMQIGNAVFEWGKRTYVMGILNVTPDSFSGDGIVQATENPWENWVDRAVARAEQLVADGADLIDVGGESTRPGSQPVSAQAEQQRVIPVIRALRARIPVPISIDTYRADTARLALDAGADLVNDVWGLRMDAEMKRLIAQRGAPVVIMHNRSKPKDAVQSERLGGRYVGVVYADLMGDIIRELREQVDLALEAGIAPDKIIIDPGIGFGKTKEQNIELLDRLGELRVLGYPILLGTSRKGFIGFTLDVPPEERVEGTGVTVALGIERGADMVRVHDVKQMARVIKMTDAIVRRT
jgi:dihydropteroate synthase